jgi:hypothetical protein
MLKATIADKFYDRPLGGNQESEQFSLECLDSLQSPSLLYPEFDSNAFFLFGGPKAKLLQLLNSIKIHISFSSLHQPVLLPLIIDSYSK